MKQTSSLKRALHSMRKMLPPPWMNKIYGHNITAAHLTSEMIILAGLRGPSGRKQEKSV